MDDVKIIPVKYSKYAYSLDKIFKSNSLETLKKNLNNPKKFRFKEFDSFLKEKSRIFTL